jgi:hypothetical protein
VWALGSWSAPGHRTAPGGRRIGSVTVAKKNIPDSGFSGDDGSADPRLAAALADWAQDPTAERRVFDALREARLLVPVVAVLDQTEEVVSGAAAGLRREKTSDMAVPTLKAAGRTALPAFTCTAALARWDPQARPVAVPLHRALQAAAHEGADTIVLDLAGPVPYQLTGPALRALAEGRGGDPIADPEVRSAVRAAVEAEPAVLTAHIGPGPADGTLALVLDPAADRPGEAVQNLAGRLAADETLRARLVHGLDLAVLTAAHRPAGQALYDRSQSAR